MWCAAAPSSSSTSTSTSSSPRYISLPAHTPTDRPTDIDGTVTVWQERIFPFESYNNNLRSSSNSRQSFRTSGHSYGMRVYPTINCIAHILHTYYCDDSACRCIWPPPSIHHPPDTHHDTQAGEEGLTEELYLIILHTLLCNIYYDSISVKTVRDKIKIRICVQTNVNHTFYTRFISWK